MTGFSEAGLFKEDDMKSLKNAVLILAAASAISAGGLWADEGAAPSNAQAAPADQNPAGSQAVNNGQAASNGQATAAAPAKAESPLLTAMKAANALLDAGQYDEAVAAYEKIGACKSKKTEGWRLNNEGLSYLLSNQSDKALPLLEKAVATDETNFTAWNNLGSCYENLNQMDKAQDAYQKSVDAANNAGADSAKAEGNLAALKARMNATTAQSGSAASDADDSDSANQADPSQDSSKAQGNSKPANTNAGGTQPNN